MIPATRLLEFEHDGIGDPDDDSVSCLPRRVGGDDADRRLRVLLGLPGLRRCGPAQAGRLLRILFLRFRPLPAQAAILASHAEERPKPRPDVAETAYRTVLEAIGQAPKTHRPSVAL